MPTKRVQLSIRSCILHGNPPSMIPHKVLLDITFSETLYFSEINEELTHCLSDKFSVQS